MSFSISSIGKYVLAIGLAIAYLFWIVAFLYIFDFFTDDTATQEERINRAAHHKFGDIFTHFLYVGIAVGAGLSTVIMFWAKTSDSRRLWIYVVILLVLMPLSFYNYLYGDYLFDRWKQAIFDVIICLLGIIVLLKLLKLKPASDDAKVMRGFAVFFISSQAILVPGIYAILWFFNIQGLINLATTREFGVTWITIVTALGGLVISILNYRLAVKKQKLDEAKQLK